MITKGLTLREAAQEWVKGFNAIPTPMIAKLWNVDPEDWQEVTNPDNEVEYYDQLPICGHSEIVSTIIGLKRKTE